jgi:chromatin segregation and condensation protein Rec8/ScpA/Scc1 (kleisin family)
MDRHPTPCPLDQLLPDRAGADAVLENGLRGRSRWTSTFVASLELARQGEVVLEQDASFGAIRVSRPHREASAA